MDGPHVRNSLVFLLLLAIGVAAFTLGYTRGWIRFVDPSRESHPIRGIDVSHHQGRIDWRQVGAAGIRFAFIKSTEGESLQDPRFAHNAAAA
ncbi:MAG: GH25 family lysozyme, partial [Myxococcota bacterium]